MKGCEINQRGCGVGRNESGCGLRRERWSRNRASAFPAALSGWWSTTTNRRSSAPCVGAIFILANAGGLENQLKWWSDKNILLLAWSWESCSDQRTKHAHGGCDRITLALLILYYIRALMGSLFPQRGYDICWSICTLDQFLGMDCVLVQDIIVSLEVQPSSTGSRFCLLCFSTVDLFQNFLFLV